MPMTAAWHRSTPRADDDAPPLFPRADDDDLAALFPRAEGRRRRLD